MNLLRVYCPIVIRKNYNYCFNSKEDNKFTFVCLDICELVATVEREQNTLKYARIELKLPDTVLRGMNLF